MRTLFVGDFLSCADNRVYVIAAHAPDGNMIGVAGRIPSAVRPMRIASTRLFTPQGETVIRDLDKQVIKHTINA